MIPSIPSYLELGPEARFLVLLTVGLVAAVIVVVLNRWLAYEASKRIARLQYAPKVKRVEVPMDQSEHEQALRRELYVAQSRITDLTGELNAARKVGRLQERAGLALHTLRAEIEQTQRHPVIRLDTGPVKVADPTVELVVVPFRPRRLLQDVAG